MKTCDRSTNRSRVRI